jgi:hypothetical protein
MILTNIDEYVVWPLPCEQFPSTCGKLKKNTRVVPTIMSKEDHLPPRQVERSVAKSEKRSYHGNAENFREFRSDF